MNPRFSKVVRRAAALVLLCALAAELSACASGAHPLSMVPEAFTPEHRHPYTVRVQSAGGRETHALWMSQISDAAFLEALTDCLRRSEVFKQVLTTGNADYLLDVSIEDVRQPFAGFDMTVSVVAQWTLTDLESGAVVFKDHILTPYTATMGESFFGFERLRMANEGAARENIREGVTRISRLQL